MSIVDCVTLSDSDLALLRAEVENEAMRRMPDTGIDFAGIYGQEAAKRALTVAAAGGHSITLCGPPGVGKSMLRSAGRAIGAMCSYECRPCPCGHRTDPRRECNCTCGGIEDCIARYPRADIFVEVAPVPARSLTLCRTRPGTSTAAVQRYIAEMGKRPTTLDSLAESLLYAAVSERGLSSRQGEVIRSVASTIAALDGARVIETRHVAEAVNYRMPER